MLEHLFAQEHLILVCELLRANLYEFQRFTAAGGEPPYFTLRRVQSITRQVRYLEFRVRLALLKELCLV